LNPSDDRWLTVEDLCKLYHFDAPTAKTHVMFLARAGRIPGAKKVMGKWRFDREKVERWDETKRAA
jgi:hypothetical protein